MTPKGSHSRLEQHLWIQEGGDDTGIVIVLIHGSLDRSSGMAHVARNIADHRTIRFDRRGYAKSIGHPGPFTVQGNSEDVEMILQGRRAILVGHSYGGNVALSVAARLGDQVLGVSTYETPLSWQPWWPPGTAGAAAASADPSRAAEDFMVRLIGRERWESLPQSTRDQRRHEGPTLKSELIDLRQNVPWRASEIDCPVLAGFGSRGAEHHKRGAQWIADQMSMGCLVSIEGAGHGAPTTHARAFVKQLIAPHLEGRSTFKVTS